MRRRPRRQSAAAKRAGKESRIGLLKVGGVAAAVAAVGIIYFSAARANRPLDENLCPASPSSITVLLVDVTDPLSVAQRQDFQNQLVRLRNSIPRYGKLIVAKVDSTAENLLQPVVVRCNPGTADDVNEWTGDPKGTQKRYRDGFERPLDQVFAGLSRASGADRSPIFESVQSVALTELLTPDAIGHPRKLVLASDLLQNTDAISFYSGVPEPAGFLESPAFRRVRADLRGVDVEIWMLERSDAPRTQPRALVELWDAAISKQGGSVSRVYNVSG